jgi:macrolide transport system ATP-binding/permease protein
MQIIRLENVFKSYRRGGLEIPVLQGVSVEVEKGELVALVGASGSGKSTLMNILGCLDRPTAGRYWFEGKEISCLSSDERARIRNGKIGFVFQNFNLLPRANALDNVRLPLDYSPERLSNGTCLQHATEMLRVVDLTDRMEHSPAELSGGQQQRVAIARSLINHPRVLLADEPTGNLDSHTSEDVLRLLQRLNQEEGLTILIVTHDENVARHAHRIIRIMDGVIVDEGQRGSGQLRGRKMEDPSVQSSQAKSITDGDSTEPPAAVAHDAMLKPDWRIFRTALTALRRNVMRSVLTCLGIIIGIAAVIAMMEIGSGSARSIEQTIASLGASVIQIDPADVTIGGVNSGGGGRVTLTPDDAQAIRRECSALQSVAPSVECWRQVVYRNRNWRPNRILGVTPDYFVVRNWPIAEGKSLTLQDVRSAASVCVIGQTIVQRLFENESPIGKEIRLRSVGLKVVGVLSRKGANVMGWDQDDFIAAPLTTIKFRVTGIRQATQAAPTPIPPSVVNTNTRTYPNDQIQLYPAQSDAQVADTPRLTRFFDLDDIWVAAGSRDNIPLAIRQITSLLRQRHDIRPGEPDDFRIRDLTEIAQTFAATTGIMTNLLLTVALISLVVGGVGIMNIMLVSVTERTHEIGIRMAMGARSRDVLRQFLVEAIALCVAGGVVGILLGRGASVAINVLLNWPTLPSISAIIASVAVAVTVGVIFGYYPAWKASRLDPIEALRYE